MEIRWASPVELWSVIPFLFVALPFITIQAYIDAVFFFFVAAMIFPHAHKEIDIYSYGFPPGTKRAMLLPLSNILPPCLLISSPWSHSTTSSRTTFTKSSNPIKVPVNSLWEVSIIQIDWLTVLSIISSGKISGMDMAFFRLSLCSNTLKLTYTSACSCFPFLPTPLRWLKKENFCRVRQGPQRY